MFDRGGGSARRRHSSIDVAEIAEMSQNQDSGIYESLN